MAARQISEAIFLKQALGISRKLSVFSLIRSSARSYNLKHQKPGEIPTPLPLSCKDLKKTFPGTHINQTLRHISSFGSPTAAIASDEDTNGLPVVPWDKTKVNSIYLTGIIGTEVELRTVSPQQKVAKARLAVHRRVDEREETDWYSLEFWGQLAEYTVRHLKVGSRIQVHGKIKIDRWVGRDGLNRTDVKVVARDLAYVEALPQSLEEEYVRKPVEKSFNQPPPASKSVSVKASHPDGDLSVEDKWNDFFNTPEQWWDNRETKSSPRQPDFRRKTPLTNSGQCEALWIESKYKPAWVDLKLAEMFDESYVE